MALCKRCALNGQKRYGGNLGICKMHAKTRCQVCGNPSLGSQLCTAHAKQEELARWLAQSQFRVVDPEGDYDMAGIRAEKLSAARFLAHQAVEEFFRSLMGVMGALYGHPAGQPPTADAPAEEQRKAA